MPAPAGKYLLAAPPFLTVAFPAFANEIDVSSASTLLPMSLMGALALGGVGVGAFFARKASVANRLFDDRYSQARGETDVALQALDALLLDRADGAAIWSGRELQMAIGATEPLSALPDAGTPDLIAAALAAPAFGARLGGALTDLFDNGVSFEMTVNTPEAGSRRIVGRPLGGRAMVSVLEGTGEGRALTADEARLRRADVMHRDLAESFDHAPIFAWRRDADGNPVWANKAYVDAVEASSLIDVVANKTELVFGDELKMVAELAERARTVGRPQTVRAATVVNGAKQTLEFREFPVANGTLGFATDVTAQIAAAEALRRQIEANESTLDRLHRGVAVFSKDLTLSYSNDILTTLWGVEHAWLDSHPSLRDILNALRERSKVPQARNFSTWRTETLERYSTLTDTHETHWHLPGGEVLHLIAQPHALGGVLLMFEDVTDRFEMRREVATASAVQKAAFGRLREGVLVLGLDGRRRLSNNAFETLWNLDEKMLEGAHIREIALLCEPLHADEGIWGRMTEFVSGATEARGTWNERLHRTDGSILGMAGTVLPDGATMFAFTDVTDSVNKERALLEQNEKLEELSGLKSAFLEGIHGASQELKIPLNTIIGFTEILGQQIFGELNDRQREYVEGVSTAANDLRLLVSGITDLAMIQADDFPFRVEPINVKLAIDATVRNFKRSGAESLSLVVDCPATVGELPGDAPRFREIIHNLISAVATDVGDAEPIEIGVRRGDDWVTLWIGATGASLSEATWSVLDDSVNGLDAPPLPRDSLGLTLVRQFVERQGGTIGLEKAIGSTREAVVCRFLADEQMVRSALNRQRPNLVKGLLSSGWEESGAATRA